MLTLLLLTTAIAYVSGIYVGRHWDYWTSEK